MDALVYALIGFGVAGLIGLLVYVIRQAAVLKMTAEGLQAELNQFKTGGFGQIVGKQLELLTQRANEEMERRERLIQQNRAELLEEQKRATLSAEQFQREFGTVTQQITALSELQGQVGELKDLLKPQQLRGELGEVIVRTLIADKLPKGLYEEDYAFANGKKVEFVIRLSGKLIPIDSKLQLEDFKRMRDAVEERQRQTFRSDFKRAVRHKIDEVKEYILPEEGTYDFAMMVIPSEAVYYDLVANKDFIEDGGIYDYARQQKVFLVSPLTFWAYLTAVAHGLRGLEIGRRAEDILASLQAIATKLRHFSTDEFRVLGLHLRNAAKQYDAAESRLKDLEGGLASLERIEAGQMIEQSIR